jgi:hypothetical protein
MEQGISSKAKQYAHLVKKSPIFIEREGSLPCQQDPVRSSQMNAIHPPPQTLFIQDAFQ